MANAVVTIKLMPDSPEINLEDVKDEALSKIEAFAGKGDTKTEIIPVAFGLKSLNIIFIMDESLGSPEELEKDIASIEGVNSVETIDVRRAIG
ncbi:elongation factor 1-beta [Candidatus Woesearchaeota archaeon]|nr:elongation factor 1-beta [Candidatus Woesearchaeota archaeon]